MVKEKKREWIVRPVRDWGASNCRCPVCGTEYFFPGILVGEAPDTCDCCGARMDGGEE